MNSQQTIFYSRLFINFQKKNNFISFFSKQNYNNIIPDITMKTQNVIYDNNVDYLGLAFHISAAKGGELQT